MSEELQAPVSLIAVNRLNDGIVVHFDDGTCAYFSAALLHATAPEATTMDEDVPAW